MKPEQNIFARFSVVNGTSYLALNYELFEINDIGEFIWECIDGKKTTDQISEEVAAKYNVKIDDVQDDVQEFINLLIERKLAEV